MKKSLLVVSSHRLPYFILQYLLKQHEVSYWNYTQFSESRKESFYVFNTILISEPNIAEVADKIKTIKTSYPSIKVVVTSSSGISMISDLAQVDAVLEPMVNKKNLGMLGLL